MEQSYIINTFMSEKVSFIDRPYSKWALAIVSILGFGWGLFQTFHTKAPKLKYEIVSQVSLFNKTNELSSVKLLVDTIDVLREDRNISLYVLKNAKRRLESFAEFGL